MWRGNLIYLKAFLRAIAILLCMFTVIGGVLFIISNAPGIISRRIGEAVFKGKGLHAGEDGKKDGHLLWKIEWIHFYPLKKMLLGLLWLSGAWISVTGILLYLPGREREALFYPVFWGTLTALSFVPLTGYIRYYRCIPYLNRILSGKEMNILLEQEDFERVLFSDAYLNRYVSIFKSGSWLVVRGTVISRKLLTMAHIRCGVGRRNPHSYLDLFYLNGKKITIDLGAGIAGNQKREAEIADFFSGETEYLDAMTGFYREDQLVEQIEKKYSALLPELEKESDKILFLLQKGG